MTTGQVAMRIASESAKPMALKFKFTISRLAGLRQPAEPSGRLWVYDTGTPGLAYLLTGKGAASYYLCRRMFGKYQRIHLGDGKVLTVEQARDAVARKNADIANGINPAIKVAQRAPHANLGALWEAYRLDVERRCRPATVSTFKSLWTVGLEAWSSRSLDISEDDIVAWHNRIGDKHGLYMANRCHELLRAMYRFAKIEPNPCRSVVPFKEQSRTRCLSADELKRLFVALGDTRVNPDIADIVRLALTTGARRGNCCSARADEFDLEAKTWTIPAGKSKNKSPMTLALVPQAVELVKPLLGDKSGYLFPSHGATGHITEVKAGWNLIKKLAKLDDCHFHDLRHSYAVWMLRGGASLAVLGRSLGHKDLNSTQVYAHLVLDDVRQHAANGVAKMFGNATATPAATTTPTAETTAK